MVKKPLVSFILGTRPEVIKLAPVILEFKAYQKIDTRVLLTGQHREMAQQVMDLFGIKADINLDIMKDKQTLTEITCRSLRGINEDLSNYLEQLGLKGMAYEAYFILLLGIS